jgi:hypothetical protein
MLGLKELLGGKLKCALIATAHADERPIISGGAVITS